jgi:rhodanese-related sulfurtransferase
MMDMNENFILVDARTRELYVREHIPGALHLPFDKTLKSFQNLSKDVPIITYCTNPNCHASVIVANKFYKIGFKKVFVYVGGIEDWKNAGYPVESERHFNNDDDMIL